MSAARPHRTPRPTAAIWTLGLSLLAVAVVVWNGSAGQSHELSVILPDATNVLAGQEIRSAGQVVGTVGGVQVTDGGRAAEMELRFDDSAWPIPTSSRFALRWGGTAMYSNRYVALTRGSGGGPDYADGGRIRPATFTTPVEFDHVLDTFDAPTRHAVSTFIDRAGVAFSDARPGLVKVLSGAAPAALDQADAVLADLDARSGELNTLIRAASSVTAAAQAANPGLGRLISGAAGTLQAVGDQAKALEATLAGAPAALASARTTLARARVTLDGVSTLTTRLRVGVTRVRQIALPLDDTLRELQVAAPDASAALTSVRQAVPDVNPLIARITQLAPELGSIGTQAVKALNCVRPYTPDLAAFFSDWGDWLSHVDGKDHYARLLIQFLLPAPSNALTESSGQAARDFPGLAYAFPRPPGDAAGQPWLLPQCGAGLSALIPGDDPEARSFNPLETLTPFAPYGSSAADGAVR